MPHIDPKNAENERNLIFEPVPHQTTLQGNHTPPNALRSRLFAGQTNQTKPEKVLSERDTNQPGR